MDNDNSRNTIIFVICALGLWFAYDFLVLQPAQKQQAAQKAIQQKQAIAQPGVAVNPDGTPAPVFIPVAQALARPSVAIDTPALTGSISLEGGRFDDLNLRNYRQTLDPKSPMVELLRPLGAQHAFFAQFGWSGQNLTGLPDAHTPWTLASTGALTPGHPVRLTYSTPQGLAFTRDIAVDDQFMFTVTDTVVNSGPAPVTITPYGAVERQGVPPPKARASASADGAFSVLGKDKEYRLKIRQYKPWAKDGQYDLPSTGGWMGIADKYWLTALVPDQKEPLNARFSAGPFGSEKVFQIRYEGQPHLLNPGSQVTETRRLFAGAKRAPVLTGYTKSLGIPRFVDAIDWGWGWYITKPLFWLIEFFQRYIGNFGLAILMLTVAIKIAFFFPANMSFESMTKMKKVQPQLDKLKERFKEDPAALQQNMMKLYKEEKINPLLGCLPMLATMPVFFGLFKVLNTTIEMRQAPFFGWIQDLSDRDPTSILTLFGAIPWDPSLVPLIGGFLDGPLHLGIWPLLYGITMILTQSMSPPAGDPTQQMIMKWIPVIFTFVMSSLPAGLIIYYCWSNSLTIVQQYIIMRRFKVDNPIDAGLRRITGKPKPAG